MRCLSIDLDYIMYPDIDFYNSFLYNRNPITRWKKMEDNGYTRMVSKYDIDQSNLMFIYNTFLSICIASIAIKTRYIKLIIFCLGDNFPPAISISY